MPKYELMAVLNSKTLQKATIFAFETNPSVLRRKFRAESKRKLPIELREISQVSNYKETEYIIQNDGVPVVHQNTTSKQLPCMSHNHENLSKPMTPMSFRISSSSGSSFSCDKPPKHESTLG